MPISLRSNVLMVVAALLSIIALFWIATPASTLGAQFLDQEFPGWEDKIDLETLDIGSPTECILGQLYGDYWSGLDVLDIREKHELYGFTGYDPETLTENWKRLVEERRAK